MSTKTKINLSDILLQLFADDSMCNYYATKWKREPINDHKFSFVNIHDFRDFNLCTEFNYLLVILSSLKGFIKYVADIWTALVLLNLTTHTFGSLDGLQKFKWVFLTSIIFSFLILLWDVRKARRIMISQDIAFAFTDSICYNFYSLKSYSCFCLFHGIEKSKNARDFLAFFVFFRLKRM
ncbi:Potassium transporter [Entomophthora muscae]|uniref:Potassium transporter n=1 Tax=Entomophthora muscae TaxID=34485 RepID=A0ACC2TGT7_9FUNG|nr:Potassium transporter [Entomophthora muscae]